MSPLRLAISDSVLCSRCLPRSHLFQGARLVLRNRRRYHVFPGNPEIVPDSLRESLALHRAWNRRQLIRKMYIPDPVSTTFIRPELDLGLGLPPGYFVRSRLELPPREFRLRRVGGRFRRWPAFDPEIISLAE